MEGIVSWLVLAVCVVITFGVVAVMFFRRTSNVNFQIKGLGLQINFQATKAGKETKDGIST